MEDVAYILGISRPTLYYRQRNGELPAGSGYELARAAIRQEEARLAEIRARLSEKVAERLIVVS